MNSTADTIDHGCASQVTMKNHQSADPEGHGLAQPGTDMASTSHSSTTDVLILRKWKKKTGPACQQRGDGFADLRGVLLLEFHHQCVLSLSLSLSPTKCQQSNYLARSEQAVFSCFGGLAPDPQARMAASFQTILLHQS